MHYEVEADDCRVVLASSSRVATVEADDFPFFHTKARRRKVSRGGGAGQNCVRLHFSRFVSLKRGMTSKRRGGAARVRCK